MSDSTASGEINNSPSTPTCPTSDDLDELFTPEIQISIATPQSISNDLEARKARSKKRKALCELAGNDPNKKSKTGPDGTPLKNRGGRPRREIPLPPRQPVGPLRLRVSKPVKAFLPPELWKLVFEQSSPALLRRARELNRNFYNGLSNGSLQSIWTTSRKLTYGDDHPDPPKEVNEIQYADLLEGQGCQSGDCESGGCENSDGKSKNRKTRKTYWAFLRRWCEECLTKKVVTVEEAQRIMQPHVGWQQCVPYAVMDSWNHYQWAGERHPQPSWAGYQKHSHQIYLKSGPEGLDKLKERFDAFIQPVSGGPLGTAVEFEKFKEDIREDMQKRMAQRIAVETWEGKLRKEHKAELKKTIDKRMDDIVKKAAQLTPPIERADLDKLQAFKNAEKIAKPLTQRSWHELKPKLIVQLKAQREKEARIAEEEAAIQDAMDKSNREALEAHQANCKSMLAGTMNGRVGQQYQAHHNLANLLLPDNPNLGFNPNQTSSSASYINGIHSNNTSTSGSRHLPPPNISWPQHPHV